MNILATRVHLPLQQSAQNLFSVVEGARKVSVYVNRKEVLKKASPKIGVLKVACSRDKMNTELVDLSNRGHHVQLQTLRGGLPSFPCYPYYL